MTKDTILQFVCFITKLELDDFAPKWERYAAKLVTKKGELTLQQQVSETKTKFQYISQHEWPDKDSDFTFMNDRKSEHFPEHNVKVLQIGGYMPLQLQRKNYQDDGTIKLIALIGHDERDIEFYKQLQLYRHLNIHQAYYESCTYGYVMEFFVPENNTDELLQQLKQRPGVESGIYRDSLVPHM
jgi:hypothetical protein